MPARELFAPAAAAGGAAGKRAVPRVVGAAAPQVDSAVVARHLAQADEATILLDALLAPPTLAQLRFVGYVARAVKNASVLETREALADRYDTAERLRDLQPIWQRVLDDEEPRWFSEAIDRAYAAASTCLSNLSHAKESARALTDYRAAKAFSGRYATLAALLERVQTTMQPIVGVAMAEERGSVRELGREKEEDDEFVEEEKDDEFIDQEEDDEFVEEEKDGSIDPEEDDEFIVTANSTVASVFYEPWLVASQNQALCDAVARALGKAPIRMGDAAQVRVWQLPRVCR